MNEMFPNFTVKVRRIVLGEEIKEKAIYIKHNSREKLGEKQGENLCENHFLFSLSTQAFLLAPKNVFTCP